MARVNGPYKHGTRYRVVVVREGGAQSTRSYATEEEALAVIRAAKRELAGGILVKDAIERHEKWLQSTGVKAVTSRTARQRLDRALAKHKGMAVASLGQRAAGIYDDLRAPRPAGEGEAPKAYAVQTHRITLAALKRFGRWLVEEGLLKRPPFEKVKPVGRANRGKAQLRVSEARALVERCVYELARGDVNALQPLLAVLLGLRASEISQLQGRDVDDGGRLLWVAQTERKTEASRRMVEVPDMLRPTLAALAEQRKGQQLIDGATRYTVHWHTKRLCRLAGVPEVPPHGLRGTHATLATSAGATAELVMAALGHTSTEVARIHYTDQVVAGAVKDGKVAKLIGKGEPS
jgi:integrase